ncbi:methylmalonyl-CoA mutase [Algoriphagus sp. 4150]|uniref:methylmalonyl-CoA mutase family protein n=1 Tax=Algoriphagus sp. 4150 TaxID=2817756 RepID=UPI0028644257|nr:methylmalonyl-CoA mutase family protein [Algoriphagus sp. 4150]MDR7132733.1 methylmalonyl-CoA mutase [Algoriphagus sp. 4150]
MDRQTQIYQAKNPVRIVTATSLFDGHDVSINIMQGLLRNSGAEVIHLGHNRTVEEIVNCAIQEDAQAVAITSYQGGHLEYFKYMYDLLKVRNAPHIKIFGGGGGTILPWEMDELHKYGIARIYSPDDGRRLGLQGMINQVLEQSDFTTTHIFPEASYLFPSALDERCIANLLTVAENNPELFATYFSSLIEKSSKINIPVVGITGTGGSGKSTLIDELVKRFLIDFPQKKIAIISVDPTKRKTGGALLGDRIRMNSINNKGVFMRSVATRLTNRSLSKSILSAIQIFKAADFDCIFLETSGIGQSGSEVVEFANILIYAMTPDYGSASQLEKIEMLDHAHLVALNKFDKAGSLDALRDLRRHFSENRQPFDVLGDTLAITGTIASQFRDEGTDVLYSLLMKEIEKKLGKTWDGKYVKRCTSLKTSIIPSGRAGYLEEIVQVNKQYDHHVEEQADVAGKLFQVKGTLDLLKKRSVDGTDEFQPADNELKNLCEELERKLDPSCKTILDQWKNFQNKYRNSRLKYEVRGKVLEYDLFQSTLSNIPIPKVSIPNYSSWGEIVRWVLMENVPGEFPYTAGVFQLKRSEESSTRMTAGEGGPERSNKRFHYLSKGLMGKRISTAHDSVTLYGEDPDFRPDIFGKIGSTGVSVCNLDDTKKLYSGFNLADSKTSVNLTINGPAPMILGFFLNAAIDQQCELYIREHGMVEQIRKEIALYFSSKGFRQPSYQGGLPEGNDGLGLLLLGVTGDQFLERSVYEKIKSNTLAGIRGTVQSDILKEDQAQNTCLFSVEFAIKMMGDIQEYFIDKNIKNFYSLSVSGYHMAEAGATPVTQLAFTLANAFTFIEYFLSRKMHIDDFVPNMSFFFSNGMDPEYAVLGRVARRIWAKTIKLKYGGNERSQKLKYHVQTSGRSLHAQEIAYNDVRTTLQGLQALSDNCNSLHTNASDEAIGLPTEASVKRAMAIQLIINQEYGLSKNENPTQGSFIIDELTQKVEQAVWREFSNISQRGGVLGAMERMYQRSKIQEESLRYEMLKHSGQLPIIGVNTFLGIDGSPTVIPDDVTRSTKEEREFAVYSKEAFIKRNYSEAEKILAQLKNTVLQNDNIFNKLMDASKVCTLGQMSRVLYETGGQYRRNG